MPRCPSENLLLPRSNANRGLLRRRCAIVPIRLDNDGPHFQAAVSALAHGFQNDPLFRFLSPDDEQRRRWLPHVMAANLRLVMPEGGAWAIEDSSGHGLGAIGALPPNAYPLSTARHARFLWTLIAQPDFHTPSLSALLRGLRYVLQWERMHFKAPHWYVYVLGVHGNHQGKGLGKRLMQPVMESASRDGVPIYLETQQESNLVFYRALGFRLTETIPMPKGGPTIWGLLRS